MPRRNRYLAIIFFLLAGSFVELLAQEQNIRVKVSNDDPKWGENITVSYTAPDSSPFASPKNGDTLYCAAEFSTYSGNRGVVVPMKHLDGGKYETGLRILDSAYSVRIEICIPSDRVPDGITIFTCRTADGGRPPGTVFETTINYDSALTQDIAHYPTHYSSYVQAYDMMNGLIGAGQIKVKDSAQKVYLQSLIERLEAQQPHTPTWYITLSQLFSRWRGHDSVSEAYLRSASEATTYDPIYNDQAFWSRFFAPSIGKGGKIILPLKPGRTITPLVVRFPKTEMAKMWLQRANYDTLLNAAAYHMVSDQWNQSQDVDLLLGIGRAYNFKKGPLYDPAVALQWLGKADESIRMNAGFYDGENIYGGMGRIGQVVAFKTEALIVLGRPDEAASLAEGTLVTVKEPYEKDLLRPVLAKAYLALGKLEDAKRVFGIILATSMRGTPDGLDELYQKSKQTDETMDAFKKRLADTYGKTETLPDVHDFSYTTLDGKSGSLKDLRGKVVALDFWFISCAGCVIEKHSLNELVKKYKGDTNVVFLSVALDDEAALKRYLERHESGFLIVPGGQAICDAVGVSGYPTHILIGRDGKTLNWDTGGSENSGDLMKPVIDQALAQK